jgi:hypothetical protein
VSGRFDLRPLVKGAVGGLRRRRAVGPEQSDTATRAILAIVPVGSAVLCLAFQIELQKADQLVAGLALLVGANLAAFAQIASWRERLTARARRVDRVNRRSLDEAAAHVLVSALVAFLATAVMIVLANIDLPRCPTDVQSWIVRGLSAFGVSALSLLLLLLVIVVNLLWDAYVAANPPDADDGETDYASRGQASDL